MAVLSSSEEWVVHLEEDCSVITVKSGEGEACTGGSPSCDIKKDTGMQTVYYYYTQVFA